MRRLKRYKLPLCFVLTLLLIISLLCLVEITKREHARGFIDQTKSNIIIQHLSSNFKLLKPVDVQTPHSLRDLNKATTSLGNSCSQVLIRYNISSHRFVIPLSYWEQLTMATNSLCAMVTFSREWRARTVAPFTRLAEFWGLPSTINMPKIHGMPPILRKGPAKSLDSIYNMTLFNSKLLCRKYGLPPLATFEEFIDKADRTITILHFNFDSYGRRLPKQSAFQNSHFINCLHMKEFQKFGKLLIKSLNIKADERKQPHFKLGHACCIDQRHVTTPKEIAKECGFYNKSFTIVPTIWRGYSKNPKKTFRQMVPENSTLVRPNSYEDAFPLNDDVMTNVTAFYRDISNDTDIIGVNLRTAKLGMLDWKYKKVLSKKCFEETWSLVSRLKKDYPALNVIYFVDYGKHGSHSAEIGIGMQVSKKHLKANKIEPVHYDPDIYGGWPDQGFVALVEQSAIAKSKILVLVGGGSFQDELFTRFRQAEGHKVYTICWTKEQLVEKVFDRSNLTH